MPTDMPSNPSGRPKFPRNWVTLGGLVIALGSLFSFLLLLTLDYFSHDQSPYLGVLTYLIAPGFLVLGVVLIVTGWLIQKRKLARATNGAALPAFVIDFNSVRDRRRFTIFLIASLGFFLISAIGSYQTYHVTKSVQFCGMACHDVMEPQYVAYQHSPHAQVECTACHIAPGAASFVKAKLGGLHQVYSTLVDKYPCPLKIEGRTKITQHTCEQCHWPKRYVGNIDRTYTHYLSDETNTPYSVRLLLRVGGGDPTHGPVGGIHWHMNLANKVEYIATDPARQKIPWVRMTDRQGKVTEFRTPDFKDDPAKHTIHTMDCMDCHNRPAHHFRAPNDSVDLAMATGRIDVQLPGIKKNAVLALTGATETQEEGLTKIAASLKKQYPAATNLQPTIAAVQDIYRISFFPAMKTSWKVYPNNLGHKDSPGCFRCHDGNHVAADRQLKIKAGDCNACHTILAEGRGAELEQLYAAGKEFKHPEPDWNVLNCYDCHNGTIEDK